MDDSLFVMLFEHQETDNIYIEIGEIHFKCGTILGLPHNFLFRSLGHFRTLTTRVFPNRVCNL